MKGYSFCWSLTYVINGSTNILTKAHEVRMIKEPGGEINSSDCVFNACSKEKECSLHLLCFTENLVLHNIFLSSPFGTKTRPLLVSDVQISMC